MKIARILSGFAVFPAILFSFLFTLTLSNRIRICHNRDQYHPATFAVDSAVYHPAGHDGFDSYWLTGTVDGQAERFIPRFPRKFRPRSADSLLDLHPRGSQIDVLYNPGETRSIIQDETLRVKQWTPDFWREQERLRNKLLYFVLLPAPLTVGTYLFIRRLGAGKLAAANVQTD
jgi:hypothetical protein